MIPNKILLIMSIVALLLTLNNLITNPNNRNNALCKSAENGHLLIVKSLVESGADIHFDNDCALRLTTVSKGPGRTLGYAGARYGHLDVVKFLIDSGADIHADNDYALRSSIEYDHTNVARILIESSPVHNNLYIGFDYFTNIMINQMNFILKDRDYTIEETDLTTLEWPHARRVIGYDDFQIKNDFTGYQYEPRIYSSTEQMDLTTSEWPHARRVLGYDDFQVKNDFTGYQYEPRTYVADSILLCEEFLKYDNVIEPLNISYKLSTGSPCGITPFRKCDCISERGSIEKMECAI